jgi:hypothetical protein
VRQTLECTRPKSKLVEAPLRHLWTHSAIKAQSLFVTRCMSLFNTLVSRGARCTKHSSTTLHGASSVNVFPVVPVFGKTPGSIPQLCYRLGHVAKTSILRSWNFSEEVLPLSSYSLILFVHLLVEQLTGSLPKFMQGDNPTKHSKGIVLESDQLRNLTPGKL